MEYNTPQFDHRKSNNTCPAWDWTLQFQCSIGMSTSRQYRPSVISILLFYKMLSKLLESISVNIIPLFSKYNLKKKNETYYQKTELWSSVTSWGPVLKKQEVTEGTATFFCKAKYGVISFLRNVDTFSNHQSRSSCLTAS